MLAKDGTGSDVLSSLDPSSMGMEEFRVFDTWR